MSDIADRVKKIVVEHLGVEEDKVMEVAIESGAEDVETDEDGSVSVITAPEDFLAVKDALTAAGLEPEVAEVTMLAQNYTDVDGDTADKVLRLVDILEDLDDVTSVYTNANLPEPEEED